MPQRFSAGCQDVVPKSQLHLQFHTGKRAKLSGVTSASKTANLDRLRPTPRKAAVCTQNINDQFLADVLAGTPASVSGLIFDYFCDCKHCCEELAIDSLIQ